MENETHMVSMAVFSKTHNFKKAIPNSVRSNEMLASLFEIILTLNVEQIFDTVYNASLFGTVDWFIISNSLRHIIFFILAFSFKFMNLNMLI